MLFYFGEWITDGNTHHIQDKIINITSAKKGVILQQFHRNNQQQAKEKCFEKTPEFREYSRKKEAQRDKHDHIAD